MKCATRLAVVATSLVAALALQASPASAAANGRSSGAVGAADGATRTISFSGHEWLVKGYETSTFGPGPNFFSDSPKNVWVDAQGRLHLKVSKRNGVWYCAEVISKEPLGHGRYSWTLDSPVDGLDPNTTLGLFTWSDTPDFNNREIDVEFARWGDPLAPTNGQFVVQPYLNQGNMQLFSQPAAPTSTHGFTWAPESVSFFSSTGSVGSWTYSGPDVPPAGDERVHMNLWLIWGRPPMDAKSQEVIISDFSFTPLAATAGQ